MLLSFRKLNCVRLILIPKQRLPLPHRRSLCPYLDFKTASTTATSGIHSKLDYCSSLYYNLPKSQITQEIENCLTRAVVS